MLSGIDSALTSQKLEQLALLIPVLVISMVLHEMAHGYIAYRLGDPTAKMLGRLSPNPVRHVDPLGSVMFAVSWIASGGTFLFGWAKPIPVQPRFFSHPQRGMAIVAIAGPITNILIAFAIALVGVHISVSSDLIATVIQLAFVLNIWLAVFNMLPIPPLDGSRVLAAFMPRQMAESWGRLDQYGFFVIFGLLFFVPQFYRLITAIRVPLENLLITLAGG